MSGLLTAAQMRSIEAGAMASGEVTGLELMERAGTRVVEAVLETWPDLAAAPRRAVVLCGPGNNGGDGFVVARLLHRRGWEVDVLFYGDAGKLPPDARTNYARWSEIGAVSPLDDAGFEDRAARHPDTALAVDALFGTGLSRPISGLGHVQMALNHWQAASRHGTAPRVVAIDMPSGLCSDSGRHLGDDRENPFDYAAMANLTVTFHAAKLGHYLADGPATCGKLAIGDIGLSGNAPGQASEPPVAELVTDPAPALLGKHTGHKYRHGHALVLSGGFGRSGAARLAARAALRTGAGLVTLGAPGSAQMEIASQITALMLRRAGDAEALTELLEDERLNALCLGPGLGLDRARELVPVALASRRATVLDADALTAFSEAPDTLFAALHESCLLTPHEGEFARLFPDIADQLSAPPLRGPAFSRADAARAAAARAGCTILLKGPDTVIADAHGRCSVHAASYDRAAPWLATAGAGDVLSGIATGLMARGASPFRAAETAAWLHTEAARGFGPGLVAEDLPEALPAIYRALGL